MQKALLTKTTPVLPIQKSKLSHEQLLPKKKKLLSDASEPKEKQENKASLGVSGEPSVHFLSTYFKEMGHLSTLTAEQELAMAKELSEREKERWALLLSLPPLIPKLRLLLKKHLSPRLALLSKWEHLVEQAGQKPFLGHLPAVQKVKKVVQALAEKMYVLDADRILIQECLSAFKVWKAEAQREIELWREEVSAFEKCNRAAEHAKSTFIQANLRLVVSLARRFYQGRMSLSDLIQEGNIGLIKAVERFDYLRGYRFSTYASWWIRHAISRALADKGRAVRVPVHMIDTYYRLLKQRRELTNKLGRQPTNEELSEAAQVSLDRIERMNGYLLEHSFSIDQTISDEDSRPFVDIMESDAPETQPMGQLIDKTVLQEINALFQELSPMEVDVLKQRFGLDSANDEERTLKEVGKKYRLSRERIRQIQEQALGKIRKALVRKELL